MVSTARDNVLWKTLDKYVVSSLDFSRLPYKYFDTKIHVVESVVVTVYGNRKYLWPRGATLGRVDISSGRALPLGAYVFVAYRAYLKSSLRGLLAHADVLFRVANTGNRVYRVKVYDRNSNMVVEHEVEAVNLELVEQSPKWRGLFSEHLKAEYLTAGYSLARNENSAMLNLLAYKVLKLTGIDTKVRTKIGPEEIFRKIESELDRLTLDELLKFRDIITHYIRSRMERVHDSNLRVKV